jgi:predicted secreted hydrolase
LALVSLACSTPAVELPDARVEADGDQSLTLSSLLSGTADGFARAIAPRRFVFPDDHGSHPDFRTEWWYLTGNVTAASGRRFGYQFTLFRNALAAEDPSRESEWSTRQIFMAHLAITDVEGRNFHSFERFARGALGLAGVELRPFRAWLEDWQLTSRSSSPPFRLQARAGDIAVDLDLDAVKPLVLQGEAGLSRKGREPGNASYYYAFTRLATSGRIRLGEDELQVSGSSWLDREWSTSALEAGQSGWDWFALQLDDGTDLMVYQMRRDDGTADPMSSGSRIDADGERAPLLWSDVQLEVVDWWTSPETDVQYPSSWRLRVPTQGLELRIEPVVDDQELRLSVLYWEGAVKVEGEREGLPISGRGYVELTGYDTPRRSAS